VQQIVCGPVVLWLLTAEQLSVMSGDYNSRLKGGIYRGLCGDAERFDSEADLSAKVHALTQLLRESKAAIVHTGAGISIAAGLPDFR
jgi:hypothetical protein